MASFNKDQGSKSAWGTKSDKGAWGKGGGSDAGSSANRAGGGRGYAVRDSSASWGDSRKTGGGGAGGRGAVGGRGGAKTHHPRPTEKACEECNAPFCSPFACMMTKVKEFTEVQSLDDVAVPNSLNGTAYLKMCVAIKKISARKDKDELFSMPNLPHYYFLADNQSIVYDKGECVKHEPSDKYFCLDAKDLITSHRARTEGSSLAKDTSAPEGYYTPITEIFVAMRKSIDQNYENSAHHSLKGDMESYKRQRVEFLVIETLISHYIHMNSALKRNANHLITRMTKGVVDYHDLDNATVLAFGSKTGLDAAITTRGPKSHDDSADHLFTVPVEVLWNCVKDAENSVATSSPHDLRTLLAKTGILKTKSRAPSSLESGGAVPEAYVPVNESHKSSLVDRLASDNLLAELKGLASASVPDLMERLLARGVKRKEEGTEVSSMDDVVITLRKSSLPMTLLEPMVNNQMLDKIGVSPIRKEYLRLIGRPSAPGAVVSDLYEEKLAAEKESREAAAVANVKIEAPAGAGGGADDWDTVIPKEKKISKKKKEEAKAGGCEAGYDAGMCLLVGLFIWPDKCIFQMSGGKRDLGETPLVAGVRETLEEFGVDLNANGWSKKLHTQNFMNNFFFERA